MEMGTNLNEVFLLYRQIIRNSTRVELKLIKTEIEEIDRSVLIGINELSWNSESNFV